MWLNKVDIPLKTILLTFAGQLLLNVENLFYYSFEEFIEQSTFVNLWSLLQSLLDKELVFSILICQIVCIAKVLCAKIPLLEFHVPILLCAGIPIAKIQESQPFPLYCVLDALWYILFQFVRNEKTAILNSNYVFPWPLNSNTMQYLSF